MSQQPQRAEASVAFTADDDVIVNRDIERPRGIDNQFGHVDVSARGRWIT